MPLGLTRNQTIALVVTAVALASAVTAAWAMQVRANQDAGPYEVTVVRGGRDLRSFDLHALESLEQRKVMVQGQPQEGPPLLEVLGAAGVRDFASVVVIGAGIRDDGRIELARTEVDEDIVLDVAERGTTKLCGPNIPFGDRVRDVERIEVR